MAQSTATCSRGALEGFYREVFEAAGVAPESSAIAAKALVFADARGIASHGAANLERIYVPRLLNGRIDASASPRIATDMKAVATLDGNRALGFVAACAAMDEAIARAREFGVGAVGVRGSTHCGCMAFYTMRAVEAGMVGFALTNLGAQTILRPPGGAIELLGTNVLAAGAPTELRAPFSLDMSTAVASTGRLRTAVRDGEELPEGWLVDDVGRPVRDPQAYFDGTAHLQFLGGGQAAGYKGYGLAVLVDILCGTLTGGPVGPRRAALAGERAEDDDVGHFMLALDVAAFGAGSDFPSRLDELLGALIDCPSIDADRSVAYPGLHEHEADDGEVAFSRELVASLERTAELLSVAPPPMSGPTGRARVEAR